MKARWLLTIMPQDIEKVWTLFSGASMLISREEKRWTYSLCTFFLLTVHFWTGKWPIVYSMICHQNATKMKKKKNISLVKNDVASLNIHNCRHTDPNDVMAVFCENKFPSMAATERRPNYHKSVRCSLPLCPKIIRALISITKLTLTSQQKKS